MKSNLMLDPGQSEVLLQYTFRFDLPMFGPTTARSPIFVETDSSATIPGPLGPRAPWPANCPTAMSATAALLW